MEEDEPSTQIGAPSFKVYYTYIYIQAVRGSRIGHVKQNIVLHTPEGAQV